MRAPVETGKGFRAGEPEVVLEQEGLNAWDVAPDGRFLAAVSVGERIRPPLIVVSDWRAATGIEVER